MKNIGKTGKQIAGSLAAFAFVAAAGLGLSSCGEAATAEKGTEVHILSAGKKVNFDPAVSQNLPITTLGLVQRRLVGWDVGEGKEPAPIGDLATDAGTPSNDGKTWTFTLKDGVKFQDGTAVTSKDIKFSVERSYVPELSGGLGYHKPLLDPSGDYTGPFNDGDLASIVTPDDKTIIFNLDEPSGDFPWIAASPAFAAVPVGTTNVADYGEHPVATGPYKVDSYTAGDKAVLSKNEFWDKSTDPIRAGEAKTVVLELGQNQDVQTQRLIADTGLDQYTFASGFVAPSQLAQIENNPTVKARLVTSDPGAIEYLALNTTHKPLDNVDVRKALQFAVDKESYRLALGGDIAGEFASTLITPGIAGRAEFDLYPAAPAGEPSKAKELLAAAGFPDGLTLKLVSGTSDSAAAKAQAIQQGLAKAGVTVNIQQLDDETLEEVETGDEGDYDLVLSGWQPDFPAAYANIQPLFASTEIGGGGYNLSRYNNPAVDAAIVDAAQTVDKSEANAKWQALDKQILEDSPIIPLIYSKNSFLRGSKLGGFYIPLTPAYPNYLNVVPE